ncbi:hypothetical protein SADUNF_Sadunf16G0214000 [Salix dunnii]|uniref:Uncharacterized protein n=1 Tax=Salix dunnii TaxID=1413687 RepID=A0A835J7Z5_9ROSI|nr:hypothetical protein SADUNF_Sadunf16G0214000 [Salix dunnii]
MAAVIRSLCFFRVLPELIDADGILINTVEELDKFGLMQASPVNPARSLVYRSLELHLRCVETGLIQTSEFSSIQLLAMTLEAGGKNFWVVRPPVGFDINFNLHNFSF